MRTAAAASAGVAWRMVMSGMADDGAAQVQHGQVSPGILYCILNEGQTVHAHGSGMFEFAPAPAGKLRGVEDVFRGELLNDRDMWVIGMWFLAGEAACVE